MFRRVLLGSAVAAVALLGLGGPPAVADQGGLGVAVSPAKSGYAAGEPITLTVTVTNRGAAACRLATAPDAVVQVIRLTRDGQHVTPQFARAYYDSGFDTRVARSERDLAPGASTTFTVAGLGAGDAQSLVTAAGTTGGSAVAAWWQVGARGRYELTAQYSAPRVAGATDTATGTPQCTGTAQAAVAFTVGATPAAQLPVALLIGGAVLLLVIVLRVVLWLARRRRPASGAAVLVVAALVGLGVSGGVGTARADPTIGLSTVDFKAVVQGCMTQFEHNDPAQIMPTIKGPGSEKITIEPTPDYEMGSDHWETPYGPNGPGSSTITFNAHPEKASDGGLMYEPKTDQAPAHNPTDACSSLYHELIHSAAFLNQSLKEKDKKGTLVKQILPGECDSTGIDNEEVRATYFQNKYLENLGPNSPTKPRETYKGKPLPTQDKGAKPGQLPKKCQEKPKEKGPKLVCADGQAGDTGSGGGQLRPRQQQQGCADQTDEARTDGDPHLTTFDGAHYDFQAVGEFVAARAGDDVQVQTRQSPMSGVDDHTLSVNTAVAVRIGADRVGFYLTGDEISVHVNGTAQVLAQGDTALPAGGVVTRRPAGLAFAADGYDVAWPDGTTAQIDALGPWGLRMFLLPSRADRGRFAGLLGDFDGKPDNDLVTRDGKPVPQPPDFDQLHHAFADGWRVSQAESLFDYGTGESTATFTDRSFPARPRTAADLPEPQRTQVRLICQAAGVTDPVLADQCALDTALTGQPAFAVNAAASQRSLPSRTTGNQPTTAPGTALHDGDVVTGAIDNTDQTREYPIDLAADQQFELADASGSIAPVLVSDNDQSAAPLLPGPYQYHATSAGRYTLRVAGTEAGPFSFRVVTLKPRVLPVRLGDHLGSGRLDAPGRVDVYTFDTGGATSVRITGGGHCEGLSTGIDQYAETDFHLLSPAPLCSDLTFGVEPNHTYFVAVWSDTAQPADYTLTLAAG